MFTWICPKCGAEVPPSYDECPNCAAAPAKEPAAPRVPAAPAAARRTALPGWLVAVLVALVLVGLGAGAYFYLLPSSQQKAPPAAQAAVPFEAPASQPAPGAKPHPLAKYIEISGVRVTEDRKQKALAKFVVVNHSGAELGDVVLLVRLKPTTAKPEDPPLASLTAKVKSLGPYESREMESSFHTALRAYELPDWQFVRAEFEIQSPPAP